MLATFKLSEVRTPQWWSTPELTISSVAEVESLPLGAVVLTFDISEV
jgi:hypothetical protein